jgi:Berberine and berberine like
MDTFAMIPVEDLRHLHMDPPTPVPNAGDGMSLVDMTSDTIDALVAVAGPGSGSPFVSVEVRQLGGAVAELSPEHGAAGTLDGAFALFGVGMALDPQMKEAVKAHAAVLKTALAPWAAERGYFNFADRPQEGEALFAAETYRRLAEIKAAVDSEELFRATHPIRPARREPVAS